MQLLYFMFLACRCCWHFTVSSALVQPPRIQVGKIRALQLPPLFKAAHDNVCGAALFSASNAAALHTLTEH